MSADRVALTLRARRILSLNQETLGDLLGLSRRTIQRWDAGQSVPAADDLSKIAEQVHPLDPVLAAELARAAGTTLEKLGLAKSMPAPPPPSPPPSPYLTDTVVCAAAEMLNVPPPAVRPALLAAFRRAREAGLGLEHVEQALSHALEPKKKSR